MKTMSIGLSKMTFPKDIFEKFSISKENNDIKLNEEIKKILVEEFIEYE